VRLAPRPCDDEREHEGRVGVDFDALAVDADLAPRDGLVRPRARVGPVELLTRVDVDGEIGAVALLRGGEKVVGISTRSPPPRRGNRTGAESDKLQDERTKSIELAIWCLQTPPPRMIMPAFLLLIERSFSLRISETMSIERGVSVLSAVGSRGCEPMSIHQKGPKLTSVKVHHVS
jgi:hypothetical protein